MSAACLLSSWQRQLIHRGRHLSLENGCCAPLGGGATAVGKNPAMMVMVMLNMVDIPNPIRRLTTSRQPTSRPHILAHRWIPSRASSRVRSSLNTRHRALRHRATFHPHRAPPQPMASSSMPICQQHYLDPKYHGKMGGVAKAIHRKAGSWTKTLLSCGGRPHPHATQTPIPTPDPVSEGPTVSVS